MIAAPVEGKKGKSVKRLGSLHRSKGAITRNDSSTKASTLLKKNQSKIQTVDGKYLAHMPSSLNMNSKMSRKNLKTPTS